MRTLILALLFPVSALAETCPPAPDISGELAPLLSELKRAPDPAAAQPLTNEIWLLWTRAPDDRAQALLDEGMAKRSGYDLTGAEALLTELVTYCPDYAEGWNQRAFVKFLDARYPEALEDLERALELSPDHFAVMSGMALTLMNLGRVEVAQSILGKAVDINPWLPERSLLTPENQRTDL